MTPFAALAGCWLLNAFWPLLGQDGVRFFSTVFYCHAGRVIGLLVLAPWLASKGRWRTILSKEAGPSLLVMGSLSAAASFIYVEALRYTTPANAAVTAQIEVLYSALLSAWLLRERIGGRQILASLLVVAGTSLIMGHDLGSGRLKGDLMILLTPWMFQVSHVFAKRLPKDQDPAVIVGGMVFYGILVMAPFSLWAFLRGARWTWSPQALSILAAQGVLFNAASISLWYSAIRRMDLAKATAFLLSYPALTMLFSWALGRESVSLAQFVGLAVTLSGAYWLSLLSRQGAWAQSPPVLSPKGASGS